MTSPLDKLILFNAENTGKRYIDPESTQIIIEALIKTKQEKTTDKTASTESLDMVE
jgi:hypothetical protein